MNIHEALLYLNFEHSLKVNGLDSSQIADLTSIAFSTLSNAEKVELPVAVLQNAGGWSGTEGSCSRTIIGTKTLEFKGKFAEIRKIDAIHDHVIGEVYKDGNTWYISSRENNPAAQRIITILTDVTVNIGESKIHQY